MTTFEVSLKLKRLVAIALTVTLVTPPVLATAPVSDRQVDTSANSNLPPQFSNEDLKEIDASAQAEFEKGKAWADEKEGLVGFLLESAATLQAKAKHFEGLYGAQFVQKRIDSGKFIIDLADGVTAEYRIIDGQRVPRILLRDSVYVLIDENAIARDSEHLRQYVARTHIESGASRIKTDENGEPIKNIFGRVQKTSGRDLTVIYVNDDAGTHEIVPMPKHHFTDWGWWKDFYFAKKKKPSLDDFTLGLFTAVALQGPLMYGLTALKHHVMGSPMSWTPALFTACFALFFGTFASAYKNFTNNSNSNLTRTLKRQFVSSMPFAYGLVIALAPGDFHSKLATVSLFSAAGLAKSLSLQINGLSNNTASAYWSGYNQIRDRSRESAGHFKVNINIGAENAKPFRQKTEEATIFNLNFEVGNVQRTLQIINWSKSNFENQVFYLVPWMINAAGILAIGDAPWSKIPGTEINVPIFQFLGIPVAMFFSRWYARHMAARLRANSQLPGEMKELDDLVRKFDSQWDNSFGVVKKLPDMLSGWFLNMKIGLKMASESCSAYLRGSSDNNQND